MGNKTLLDDSTNVPLKWILAIAGAVGVAFATFLASHLSAAETKNIEQDLKIQQLETDRTYIKDSLGAIKRKLGIEP